MCVLCCYFVWSSSSMVLSLCYAIHISFVVVFLFVKFFLSFYSLFHFYSVAFSLFLSLIYVRISFRVRWFFYINYYVFVIYSMSVWVYMCIFSLLHRLDLLFAILNMSITLHSTACVVVWTNYYYIVRLFVWSVLTLSYPLFFISFGFLMHSQVFFSFRLHLHLCMEICLIFFSIFFNYHETFHFTRSKVLFLKWDWDFRSIEIQIAD